MTLHRLQTEHLLVDVFHQPPPVARVDGALDQSEVSIYCRGHVTSSPPITAHLTVLLHLLAQELGRRPAVGGDQVGAAAQLLVVPEKMAVFLKKILQTLTLSK